MTDTIHSIETWDGFPAMDAVDSGMVGHPPNPPTTAHSRIASAPNAATLRALLLCKLAGRYVDAVRRVSLPEVWVAWDCIHAALGFGSMEWRGLVDNAPVPSLYAPIAYVYPMIEDEHLIAAVSKANALMRQIRHQSFKWLEHELAEAKDAYDAIMDNPDHTGSTDAGIRVTDLTSRVAYERHILGVE